MFLNKLSPSSALVKDLGEAPSQEFVTLNLQINGHSERCKVLVTDGRDFQGADGVSKGAAPSDCTLAFRPKVEKFSLKFLFSDT